MQSVGLDHNGEDDNTWEQNASDGLDWQSLLQELQECKELSHAEVNAKRKRLTFVAFSDVTIPAKVSITDTVVMPNVLLMDKLFKRSGTIGLLYQIPPQEKEKRAELMDRRECSYESRCWALCLQLLSLSLSTVYCKL